ncbi:hypothetical protein UF13_08805 [Pantoea agglomerans]|nr:hypothetical protein UF13_08805 [Pantoea agglomerans]
MVFLPALKYAKTQAQVMIFKVNTMFFKDEASPLSLSLFKMLRMMEAINIAMINKFTNRHKTNFLIDSFIMLLIFSSFIYKSF